MGVHDNGFFDEWNNLGAPLTKDDHYIRMFDRMKGATIADLAHECAQTTEHVKVCIFTRRPDNSPHGPMALVYVCRDIGHDWKCVRDLRKQEFHTFMHAYAVNVARGYGHVYED